MLRAVIRHHRTGVHFLADLNELGTAISLSMAVFPGTARDPATGRVDWDKFAGEETVAWEHARDRWPAGRFEVVHRYGVGVAGTADVPGDRAGERGGGASWRISGRSAG
jgi:hypothetical protein